MRKAVPQLAAFVNRARCLWRAVTADTARKRKLLHKLLETSKILALVRINLCVHAFEVAVRKRCRCAMTRTGNVHQIKIILLDESV